MTGEYWPEMAEDAHLEMAYEDRFHYEPDVDYDDLDLFDDEWEFPEFDDEEEFPGEEPF